MMSHALSLTTKTYIYLVLICLTANASASLIDGFGRFGRNHEDGLLTLNSKPGSFSFPFNGPEVDFADSSTSYNVIEINQTAKTVALAAPNAVEPEKVYTSILYPGIALDYGEKDRAEFVFDSKINTIYDSTSDFLSSNAFLVEVEKGAKTYYLLFTFQATLSNIDYELTSTPQDSRLTFTGSDIGFLRISTPVGLSTDLSVQDDDLRNESMRWSGLGFPVLNGREFEFNPAEMKVTIKDSFSCLEGENWSPLSPVLTFAMANGYPAEIVGGTFESAVLTKYGFFSGGTSNEVRYTLPIPPLGDRGYISEASPQTKYVHLLNSLSEPDRAISWGSNAVDLGYVAMANTEMAKPYLSESVENRLDYSWSQNLSRAFDLPSSGSSTWKERTEPFSQLTYLWTYRILGPAPAEYMLDLEWGIALPLYGLYKYAQFRGDWEFVENHWSEVKEIYKYFDYAEDWAWMTVVNGDIGYSTGTGDPLCAAYIGQLAAFKMAQQLSKEDDAAYFAYKLSRVAVPTVARFWYSDWAEEQGLIPDNHIVQGFWEKSTFTSTRVDDDFTDPWGPTNVLSGNGIQPELFNLYLWAAGEALENFEQKFEAGYPDWADESHTYSISTTYQGNSVYVTFPHIYLRASLGEETETLKDYLDSASTNLRSAYYVGPNVVAEVLSRDLPLILTEWSPARYIDGSFNESLSEATLTFSVQEWSDFTSEQEVPWKLDGALSEEKNVKEVFIEDLSVPFFQEENHLHLEAIVSGTFEVRILFEERVSFDSTWLIH